MTTDLLNWSGRAPPARHAFNGKYVQLEPLVSSIHGEGLFEASSVSDATDRFRWLPDKAPQTRPEFQPWLEKAAESVDPLYFAIIDKVTGKVAGRQSLMAIDVANGSIEIGHIYWGPLISRRPAATEAFFLLADYAFSDLGYRRFQWRCNNWNEPSKRAAQRFGFKLEGVFRQHMVIKGENRDTAWFSILDSEWPLLREAFKLWLAPNNFDTDGQQVRRFEQIRSDVTKAG
jgi:RimJ/RimL family protein N-acetyltransferase